MEFDVLTKKHDYGYKDHVKASTALTYLVYNIFRYEQLCRCQPALVEKALANVQG
jgi:hypothetical protein